MVKEVVAAGEAMAWYCSLTVAEVAKVRSRTVTVHTMSLTLVAKKTSSRRELHADTGLLVAAERLQM
jgi:hypothetical protein